jgi:hypothetical protein
LVYSPLFIIISNSLSHGPCMDHWRGDFCFVLTSGRPRSALTPAAWALLTQKQASTACCSKELIPWKRLDDVRWTSKTVWTNRSGSGCKQHETTRYQGAMAQSPNEQTYVKIYGDGSKPMTSYRGAIREGHSTAIHEGTCRQGKPRGMAGMISWGLEQWIGTNLGNTKMG